MGDDEIARAFERPVGTSTIRDLAAGKTSAVIAVDDLTRPTPAHRFLRPLIDEVVRGGIPRDRIRILMGAAAHRPMGREEMARKLGAEVLAQHPPIMHDFLGPDIRRVGWLLGGPVDLNRHLLDAELRILTGGVIPHAETGFGGGAKMVVPGLAGRRTIAHFHGALPPRPAGQIESDGRRLDRRAWAEAVARHVGIDAAVCAVMNSRRELAGLHVGDVVGAHRAAARQARDICLTVVPRDVAENVDIVVAGAYPLDTDPIQMGKSLAAGLKLGAPLTIVLNRASDGILYHGMGMGCGIDPARLLRNLPAWLRPRNFGTWLRGMLTAARQPMLAARFCYFTLNYLSYERFQQLAAARAAQAPAAPATDGNGQANPLVVSSGIPAWGFRRKYPKGRLYPDWPALMRDLAGRFAHARVLVFPCAPMQLLEVEGDRDAPGAAR
jgi:hypothetical protein